MKPGELVWHPDHKKPGVVVSIKETMVFDKTDAIAEVLFVSKTIRTLVLLSSLDTFDPQKKKDSKC